MNLSLSLLLLIFAALCIQTESAPRKPEQSIYNPTADMLILTAKKTQKGWLCGGVYCPKARTMSCKTTNILKPTEKVEHDLFVVCLDGKNFPFCGLTRSSRVIEAQILEMDDVGDMVYNMKEKVTTTEGATIPMCIEKRGPRSN